MTRSVLGKATFVALATVFAAAAAAGCSSNNIEGSDQTEAEPRTGQVGMAIVVGGYSVNSVDYTVTGPNEFSLTGTIDVSDPNSTVTLQFGAPAGDPYTISMSATTEDGVACTGEATFAVTAGGTTAVTVELLCGTPTENTIGNTEVTGEFLNNQCPAVSFYAVSPSQVSEGGTISLNGGSTPPAGPGPVEFSWTASSGTVADPTAAQTTFICGDEESVTLTFTVTQGPICSDSSTVDVTCVQVGTCGDGVVEGSEQCDDGNTTGGDGCSATCTTEECGNGTVDVGEVCDDGNQTPADGCEPDCTETPIECGNGIVQTGEQCDDGNTDPGDGCDENCQTEADLCGNYVVDPGEQCDPPNTNSCDANCQFTACGTCQNSVCPTQITDCFNATDSAAEGPAAGVAKAELCTDVYRCAASNDCYAVDAANCYCGAGQSLNDCLNNVPGGPCVSEFQRAGESTTGADIEVRLSQTQYALGRAGSVFLCDQFVCTAECIQ